MKNIILLTLMILFSSCKGQKIKQKKDQMKYYDIAQYKDWEFDTKYCWPQSHCSREDKNIFLMKGNERVKIITYDEDISVERRNIINPYIYTNYYNIKSKLLKTSCTYFFNESLAPIGVERNYDGSGRLIKEKDWDKPYKFSIQDLIKKFKQVYKIDIENRKNVKNVYRFENIDEINIPVYEVWINTDELEKWIVYIINGKTGETLYERKVSYGDEIDVVNEYLKSIGKFKDTPSKSNPATSQRSRSLSNKELGKSYVYGDAIPQNTHQIYEGKAYTKTEWETFQKSLPWWKKIL